MTRGEALAIVRRARAAGVDPVLTGADLRGADLRCADLKGAVLPGADLRGADLSRARLSRAVLSGARLSRARLSRANLSRAVLSHARLSHARLSGADLSRADLRGADLRGAVLSRADLAGADLSGTCLDPLAVPSGAGPAWERIRCRDGTEWVRGWRTRRPPYCGDADYGPGTYHEAPVFSTAPTDCHPGIYLWPSRAAAEAWVHSEGIAPREIVEVLTRPWEVHEAGGKYRCRWLLGEDRGPAASRRDSMEDER